MSEPVSVREPVVDWLTVAAIAAIAISINVAFHEGVHALACVAVGGHLQEYSALYAECDSPAEWQAKVVAGSAPTCNMIAGTLLWILVRHSRKRTSEMQFFLWLLMMMNWFYGAGYLIISGITNVGDWAVVIDGWEPAWLWRVFIAMAGTLLFVLFVRLALQQFGTMVGGETDEQIRRGNKLCTVSYVSAMAVVLVAGFFCPHGLLSLAVIGGMLGVLGALSPLLYMMRWFRTDSFVKLVKAPLEIHRKWQWLAAAPIVVLSYAYLLGRTLYFQ